MRKIIIEAFAIFRISQKQEVPRLSAKDILLIRSYAKLEAEKFFRNELPDAEVYPKSISNATSRKGVLRNKFF
jgi:hypothetical protein